MKYAPLKIALLICFFGCSLHTSVEAQAYPKKFSKQELNHHYVFLKDGSTIRAIAVVESADKNSYTLKLSSGTELQITKNEVARIKKPSRNWRTNHRGKMSPVKGRYIQIMTGLNANSRETAGESNALNVGSMPLHFSYGFFITQRIAIGAGAAYDVYNNQGIIPIFFEGKYFLAPNQSWAPYVGARIGAGPGLNWRHRGGGMVNPHIGIRAATRGSHQFVFEFGVKMQQQNVAFWNNERRILYKRYNFSVGMSF